MSRGQSSVSGRPPDPNALVRNRKDDPSWTTLPAAGRTDPTPPWPLHRASSREYALWVQEWRRPQALMWERNQQENEVALYVRRLVEAERPGAPAQATVLVLRLQESLGISVPGQMRNRWRIEDAAPTENGPKTGTVVSARDRFTVVNDPA